VDTRRTIKEILQHFREIYHHLLSGGKLVLNWQFITRNPNKTYHLVLVSDNWCPFVTRTVHVLQDR